MAEDGGERCGACATSRARARVRRVVRRLGRACCYQPANRTVRQTSPAAAVTGLQQFLQQQPSRFRGPFEVLRRCGTGVLCLLASPALLSSLHTILRRSWSAPCASCCPRARCTSATRSGLFPKNPVLTPTLKAQTPTPNPNPITLTLTPTSPCRPHRGTAIVSTAGFALPLAAAPSAACRYPDATATGQPSARSPP